MSSVPSSSRASLLNAVFMSPSMVSAPPTSGRSPVSLPSSSKQSSTSTAALLLPLLSHPLPPPLLSPPPLPLLLPLALATPFLLAPTSLAMGPARVALAAADTSASSQSSALSVTMPTQDSIMGASPLMDPRFAMMLAPSVNGNDSLYLGPTTAALSLPRTLKFVLDSDATDSVFRDAGVLRFFPRSLSIQGAGDTMTMTCTAVSSLPCPASPSGAVCGLYVPSYPLVAWSLLFHDLPSYPRSMVSSKLLHALDWPPALYLPSRVWGCVAHVLVNPADRSRQGGKLVPKTQLCAFLGINSDCPGYLFYAPSSHQLIRSQDIIFDETRSPFLPSPPAPPAPSLHWSGFDQPPSISPSPPPIPPLPAPPPAPASIAPPSYIISGASPPASSSLAPLLSSPPPSSQPPSPVPTPPPSPRLTRSMTRALSNFQHSALFTRLSPSHDVDLLKDCFEELFNIHPISPLLCVTIGDFSNSPTLLSVDTGAIPTPQSYSKTMSGFHATELYILAYVDDLVLLAEDSADLAAVKKVLKARILCKDLGELRHYLGMEIRRGRAACTISLSQSFYIHSIFQQFEMSQAKPVSTPLRANHQLTAPAVSAPSSELRPYPDLVGSLMYAMMCTRPDLAYPLSVLSRFVGLGRHIDVRWAAAKRVLRYLRATSDLALTLGGSVPPVLSGYHARLQPLIIHICSNNNNNNNNNNISNNRLQRLFSLLNFDNQPVHATTAAASSTAAAAIAASAATTAAAAVTGSSSQPGQQSNFVPTGPYQYQGAYQPANLQQRVNAVVLSLNQMFPTAMSVDGSSYQRGQMPQGSDGSNNSFSFGPAGQGQQTLQGSQVPSLYQLQSADGTGNYIPASANPTKIKTTMPLNGQDFYTWSFEFELLVQTAGFWQLYDGTAPFPSHVSPLQQATFRSASLIAYTVLNPVVVTVANNQRLTAYWMGSIVLDSVEEDFSLHLNKVLLVPRLGFNLMSSAQLMKNGITLLGEPGKFTLKYRDKKIGTAVEQNGVFVLNFIPERTTADSDNILSLGPWEHRDDIDYTDDTVPREGVVPTSSTTAAAVMLTFDDQGLNDVQSSREYMAAVEGWGDPTNMPIDDSIWGAAEPDETTWGETPAERDARLLAEAEQRVADMEILDSGRLVRVEPVPAASDQESGELVLAPGEYVDVEVRVPPPNLTHYAAPAFDQIRSDGHQLMLSFFANVEYYLRAQGHKATGETWHKRLGHPSQSTLNNTIKAAVLDKNSLLLPSGLELKPVNRSAPCTICPAANLPHEPFPTHFLGAEDYHVMDKVYSNILNLPADGFNSEHYVITFTEASTRYVWTGNMTNRFLAFTAFRTWLPLAERESDTKLKAFQCDGAGEYRNNEFTTYMQERGIR
ncbi:unnamed protein product [Closterium sp. NIES-54]